MKIKLAKQNFNLKKVAKAPNKTKNCLNEEDMKK